MLRIAGLLLLSIIMGLPFINYTLAQNPPDSTEFIYWSGGAKPGRASYELAIAKAALERSIENFGPYELNVNNTRFPTMRGRSLLAEGELFHFVAMTFAADEAALNVIVVPEPIQFGLLGNRQLLVWESDLDYFDGISKERLSQMRAGQGRGWPDVNIYHENGFMVETYSDFDHLFPNLLAGRIDYIPLGIEEAGPSLEQYGHKFQGMAIVPKLLIQYPMPVYFIVSASQPELAERLEWGMTKLRSEGRLLEIFVEYKSDLLQILKDPETQIIGLENPNLYIHRK